MFYVYGLRLNKPGHRFDGLIRYVGFSNCVSRRLGEHAKAKTAIGCSIRRHGRAAYSAEILGSCDGIDGVRLMEVEAICQHSTLWIDGSHGLNFTGGGEGVVGLIGAPLEKKKAAIRNAHKSEGFKERHRAAIKAAMARTGVRERQLLGLSAPHVRIAQGAHAKGRPMTEAQMLARCGPKSEGHKRKIGAANSGKPKSAEHRKKLSDASRRVAAEKRAAAYRQPTFA
jgi:hypothetical protein